MGRNQRLVGTTLLLAVLLTSLFFAGTARAQGALPAFVGRFTLLYQVHWGKIVLQPGNYTITIVSTAVPTIACIRNTKGDAVTYVASGARSRNTIGMNALLIKEKDGELRVHSLELADLEMVLIYDRSLARETVEQARVSHTVPVTWAKK